MILLYTSTGHCIQPVIIIIILIGIKLILCKDISSRAIFNIRCHHPIGQKRINFINCCLRVTRRKRIHCRLFSQFKKISCTHSFRKLRFRLKTNPTIIGNSATTNFTFFSCNQNHSIRSTRTIESCSRGIFQYLNRSNIIQIDRIKSTSEVIHNQTIHYINRIGSSINGIDTTNFNSCIITRFGSIRNQDSCNTPL